MSIFKTPYELSVWDDVLTLVDSEDNEYEMEIPSNVSIRATYYKEKKLFIIGTHEMDSPFRAFQVKLKQEIKGQNTLTFSMLTKYFDEERQVLIDNPLLPFLTNERKIKLKFKQKGAFVWKDFIIKKIDEDSETYRNDYTATDLFVNELAKNGFKLVFDAELENNTGTVNELGAKVLAGTDWRIGENSEIIHQTQQEGLYKIVLNSPVDATNVLTNEIQRLNQGETIYAFYSSVINQDSDFFQFLYRKDGNYLTDEDKVIYNADNYCLSFLQVESDLWPYFADSVNFTNIYRGKKYIRHQKVVYDEALGEYVKIYLDQNDQEIRGYERTEYISAQLTKNLITNNTNFLDSTGWKQKTNYSVQVKTIPDFALLPGINKKRKVALEYRQSKGNWLFNSGINDHLDEDCQFAPEDQLYFRCKIGLINENQTEILDSKIKFLIRIMDYSFNSKGDIVYDEENLLASGETENYDLEGYNFGKVFFHRSLSKEAIRTDKIGIFITIQNGDEQTYYIQDVQLFKTCKDGNGNVILPDGKAFNESTLKIEEGVLAYSKKNYYYYYPNFYDDKNQIEYVYIGEKPKFTPKYDSNFEKIRSLTISETNRFDILQTLSETFECWCKFEVKHKETGEIKLGRDCEKQGLITAGVSNSVMDEAKVYSAGTSKTGEKRFIISENEELSEFQQQKFVSFHKNIGQINNVDFVYGINLKAIKRSIDSESIVSKLIVKNNNNEFATDGSCSISRAIENPSGENFIYNFNYYINQGMLNYENVSNDLYSLNTKEGWLGYYANMKKYNNLWQEKSSELSSLKQAEIKAESELQILSLQYDGQVKSLQDNKDYFFELTSHSYEKIEKTSEWLKEPEVIALISVIQKLETENIKIEESLKVQKEQLKDIQEKILNIQAELADINLSKKWLNEAFEKKYNRFIQEAPWTSEDYIDDNLYYLDAESTLHKSSQPKISYTVNIIELSALEDFRNFSYEIGDITHMQDTEFFGWVWQENDKLPYREKITVTEKETNFDEPEKDTIKVQNYRTQFEDLFQRLTVTSQKVEFHSGAYDKISSLVDIDGNINSQLLQDSLENNAAALRNIKNQSVVWDDSGITTKNLTDPNEIMRITSGGMYLSQDGGVNWTTGITGKGINAKTITTGQLNTELITIINGNQPSFRWDRNGINAYFKKKNGDKFYYDNRTFVRFDQYGLYGAKDLDSSFIPTSEEDIWNKSDFALTWHGFMLKSKGANGSISIDNEKDFNVYNKNKEELIRIGRLDEKGEQYGIRINNQNKEVFVANQNGLAVGGWIIEPGRIYSKLGENSVSLYSKKADEQALALDDLLEDGDQWAIKAGDNFGVTYRGTLYANNAEITGHINATSGSIGGIAINENGELLIPSNKVEGLSVTTNSQNQNKNLLYASVNEHQVKIAEWDVTKEGLKGQYEDNGITYESLITPTAIIVNDKTITWKELIDFVQGSLS